MLLAPKLLHDDVVPKMQANVKRFPRFDPEMKCEAAASEDTTFCRNVSVAAGTASQSFGEFDPEPEVHMPPFLCGI